VQRQGVGEGGGGEGRRGERVGVSRCESCCGIKGHVERRVYTRERTEVWAHDRMTHTYYIMWEGGLTRGT
jgi:hypothetical protein